MQSVTIIAVGRIKERFFTEAASEYIKRLKAYCRLEIIEIKDEPTPENPSARERDIVLCAEGERIMKKIPKGATVISLCVEGIKMSSEKLADYISGCASSGKSSLVFIIGGSFGLSDEVKALSKLKLSFSDMTFPHQLMRIILLEQIYRAYTITQGKTYHK